MGELKTIVEYIQAGGLTGLLIILAIPKLRKMAGFTNGDYAKDIKALWNEIAAIKNNHLHHIQSDVSNVKTDIAWIKGKLDN